MTKEEAFDAITVILEGSLDKEDMTPEDILWHVSSLSNAVKEAEGSRDTYERVFDLIYKKTP